MASFSGKLYALTSYEDFECSCTECRMDCCSGWRIPLDESERDRFMLEKGILGLRLKAAVRTRDGIYMFNPESHRCPFHTSKGLCGLQLSKGEDFLPFICRRYPRRIANYGGFAEVSLDLTCFYAACMFLDRCTDIGLKDITGRVPTDIESSYLEKDPANDDTDYLEALVLSREYWTVRLKRTCDIRELGRAVYELVSFCRDAQTDMASGVSMGDTLARYKSTEHAESDKTVFPPDILLIHEMFSSELYHERLQLTANYLYRLINDYFDVFSGKAPGQAHILLDGMYVRFLENCEQAFDELKGFIIYHLYTDYLESYGDYSPARHVSYGIIEAELIFTLEALSMYLKKPVEKTDRAMIISAVLRRIRHNDDVRSGLVKIFNKYKETMI